MKTIIIHADDAGLSQGTNDAIHSLLNKGIVHSTSILSQCAYAQDFVTKANKHWDMGLHISLDPEHLNSHNLVYEVITRQWDVLLSLGVRPTHIDCHAGMCFFNLNALDAYLQFCVDYKTPPILVKERKADKLKYVIPVGKVIEHLKGKRFAKLDDIWLLYNTETYEDKLKQLDDILASLDHGVNQIIVHPDLETEQGRWDYEALTARASILKGFDSYNWKKFSLHWNLLL